MDQDCWFHVFSFLYPTDLINLHKTNHQDFCDLVVQFFKTKPLDIFSLHFLISICSDFSSSDNPLDPTAILESKSVPGLSFFLKKAHPEASIGFNNKFLLIDFLNILPALPIIYLGEFHSANTAFFFIIVHSFLTCFKFHKRSLKWSSSTKINLEYIKKSFDTKKCFDNFYCYLLNNDVFLNINLNDNIVRCQYFNALDSIEMLDHNRTFCFPFTMNNFYSDSFVASINSPLVLYIKRKFHLFWPLLSLFVSFDCIFEHMYQSIVFIQAFNLPKNQKCFFVTKCDNVLYSIGSDLIVYQHGQFNTPIEFISDDLIFSDCKISRLGFYVCKNFIVSKINIISLKI